MTVVAKKVHLALWLLREIAYTPKTGIKCKLKNIPSPTTLNNKGVKKNPHMGKHARHRKNDPIALLAVIMGMTLGQ
jgi:hypothetical protein